MRRLLWLALIVWSATASVAWILAYVRHPDLVIPFGIPAVLFLMVGVFLVGALAESVNYQAVRGRVSRGAVLVAAANVVLPCLLLAPSLTTPSKESKP